MEEALFDPGYEQLQIQWPALYDVARRIVPDHSKWQALIIYDIASKIELVEANQNAPELNVHDRNSVGGQSA
eukprot:11224233-Karenia_brevis.AAC.1